MFITFIGTMFATTDIAIILKRFMKFKPNLRHKLKFQNCQKS